MESLLLDTRKNIFEGNRELFRGLLIEEPWNWEVGYPVIQISFIGGIHSKADLEEDLVQILDSNEERLGLERGNKSKAKCYFTELIKNAFQRYHQKVFILIDLEME
ncbi:MAG: AAA family ATPase [Chlorobium sp.]